MRLQTVARIVIGSLIVVAIVVSLFHAVASPELNQIYVSARAVIMAVIAMCLAVIFVRLPQ